MTSWILQTHLDSLGELVYGVRNRSEADRAIAELDALLIWENDSVALAEEILEEPPSAESLAAATLVVMFMRCENLYPAIINHFCGDDNELRASVRMGLRLSPIYAIQDQLTRAAASGTPEAKMALVDVLAFHRIRVPFDLSFISEVEDPESRVVLLEALGRLRNPALILPFETDTDPLVRRAFWKSLAMSGYEMTAHRCQQKVMQHPSCHDAIRFLGVVASEDDIPLLRNLAGNELTAPPAVHAMGVFGITELIPDLLNALGNPITADSAANALERITGRLVPRSDPPPPPDHLTEEELDFWSHPGDPIPEAAQEWWSINQYDFEPGKRYQAGRCVSDDPLGAVFDELPDEIRSDVYLRERALGPDETPDWELETWPQFQKNPSWASHTIGDATHTM